MKNDADSWMDRWLDGDLNEADTAKLNDWLKADPANAAEFAERTHLHSLLHDWAQTKVAQPAAPTKPRWQTRWMPVAAAASLVLGVGWAFWPDSKTSVHLATLVNNPGSRLTSSSLKSAALFAGEYELPTGLAELLFANGVEVVIEAPARFRLDSVLKLVLHDGRLAANVPPSGIGFTVVTPTADVIDFGTEFGVEVADDQSSEVHVFEGEVEVKPKSVGATVKLVTNKATRLDRDGTSPKEIQVDGTRFIRSLNEGAGWYSRSVRSLEPALYYRMGLLDENLAMRDASPQRLHPATAVSPAEGGQMYGSGAIGLSVRFTGDETGPRLTSPTFPEIREGRMSLATWVFQDRASIDATLAARWDTNGDGTFRLGVDAQTGCALVQARQEDGRVITVSDPTPLPEKEWQHLAFVADGTVLHLYRNGIEVAQAPCGPLREATALPFTIGSGLADSEFHQPWRGRIDEIAVFNHSLTPNQIATIANLQK